VIPSAPAFPFNLKIPKDLENILGGKVILTVRAGTPRRIGSFRRKLLFILSPFGFGK
jgi:hypothetical protein